MTPETIEDVNNLVQEFYNQVSTLELQLITKAQGVPLPPAMLTIEYLLTRDLRCKMNHPDFKQYCHTKPDRGEPDIDQMFAQLSLQAAPLLFSQKVEKIDMDIICDNYLAISEAADSVERRWHQSKESINEGFVAAVAQSVGVQSVLNFGTDRFRSGIYATVFYRKKNGCQDFRILRPLRSEWLRPRWTRKCRDIVQRNFNMDEAERIVSHDLIYARTLPLGRLYTTHLSMVCNMLEKVEHNNL